MKKYERPQVEMNDVITIDVLMVSNVSESQSFKDGLYESWGK